MLSGLGTLYLLFALVVLSHALQIGIVVVAGAVAAWIVLLARRPGARELPADDLPPAERVPAQRRTHGTTHGTTPESIPEDREPVLAGR